MNDAVHESAIRDLDAPPHSIEAEQSILGGVMLDNAAWSKVEYLRDGDFYNGAHRETFAVMRQLVEARAPVDVVTLADALQARKQLEYVGGKAYLGALVENVPTAANIGRYAEIVCDHALRRRLAETGHDIAAAAFGPSIVAAGTLLDDACERIDALARGNPQSGRLRFLTAEQVLHAPGLPWRVVKIIPGRGVIVIYGERSAGKTFFVFDLVAAIAHRDRWFGHRVKRGAVVYLAAEGHLRQRLKAYTAEHPDADLSLLRVLQASLDLMNADADLSPLLAQLRALAIELGAVAAVVIDTLNAVMPGGDENASEAMGAVIAAARKIAEALGCVVILIHHAGKDPGRGPRGFSGLTAAVDCQILVTDRDGLRCAEVEKLRDGEGGEKIFFKLKPHTWPSEDPDSEEGDMDGSCTVEPVLGQPVDAQPKASRRDVALDSLREAIGEHGETLPQTSAIPPGTKAVRRDLWGRQWLLRTGNDYDSPKVAESAFRRERQKLLTAGVIAMADPFVWIV